MKNISSREVRDNLSDVLNNVAYKGEKYMLTRSGKSMGVLLSVDEWRLVEKILQQAEDDADTKDADEAHSRYLKEGGVPLNQLKKDLGL